MKKGKTMASAMWGYDDCPQCMGFRGKAPDPGD